MNKQERARFTECVSISGGCWLWRRPLDKDGYGVFWFRRLNRRAHRVSYWASVGDIPAGHVVDHTCNNRACVNPDHLRALAARENTLRGSGHGAVNARKETCPRGHPYDRKYGNQRYCSICEAEKRKRLQKAWREADTVKC